ncbi:MAG TPA: YetF domain-containing protein [Chitinophagales bacterium]|nr:YetF domain-containing protein [Chitinophagales bacterium]
MNFDITSVLIIAGKSIAIYLFIVFAIRLFGKKEIAQLSVVDLVFILLISNSVQNAMVGPDNTLLGGIVAATALFVINYILKFIMHRFPSFNKIIEGESLMLIYEGEIQGENLDKSMITTAELEAAVREHGVEKIADVDLAILEADGNISVMTGYHHKTTRKRKTHKGILKK